jgi:hypothetical protein
MRRFVLSLALLLSLTPAFARNHHGNGISINTMDDEPLTSCDQIRATFDDVRVAMVEQDLGGSGARSLHVDASRNGGVYVIGSDVSTFSVKACKAIAPNGSMSSIRVGLRGDTTYAEGPDDADWVVYYIVTAPRRGDVQLSAHNGPISVRDMTGGSITARVENGPIALKNDGGTIDAEATNGPVSFWGDSGTVKLRAQNGPVSVHLAGSYWVTGSLDASTQNGPLSLRLPAGYRSGVVVDSDGHGPVSCSADVCRAAMRAHPSDDSDDDWPRHLQLGSGPATVHLATVNGPLSIKEQ